MKDEAIPEPIGKFIMNNAKGKMSPDGMYYHYADVCTLLKKYAQSIIENTGCQCSEPIGYTTIKCCNHCGESIEVFWNKPEYPDIFENNNHLDKPDNKVELLKFANMIQSNTAHLDLTPKQWVGLFTTN